MILIMLVALEAQSSRDSGLLSQVARCYLPCAGAIPAGDAPPTIRRWRVTHGKAARSAGGSHPRFRVRVGPEYSIRVSSRTCWRTVCTL